MQQTKIIMLGTRGSIPVDGHQFAKYGGASTCVLVSMAGETIIFDGGTGILSAMNYIGDVRKLHILISHPHADHIQGLAMFAPMFDPRYVVDVYADDHMGYSTREQIELFMSTPLWPCGPEMFQSGVTLGKLPRDGFDIGAVRLSWIEGSHPGGCSIFRLQCGNQSIVYCTDFEHDEEHTPRLIEFAKGCDLLIYDAQYSTEEYTKRRGYGHSTWWEGCRIGEVCGAKQVLLTHHAPERTDAELDELQAAVQKSYPNCIFARCREEVFL